MPHAAIEFKKHQHYWLQEGDIVIRVQNTLFKLPLSVLHETKSPVLMTISPPLLNASKSCFLSGYNEAHPFVLQDTSEHDFSRLLWVLFPSDSFSFTEASVDDWMSILKLAAQYEIGHIHDLAMMRLHALQIDPLRKLLIWRKYKLDSSLLRASYIALCQRDELLTLDVLTAIGNEDFVRLAAARELYRQRVGCEHSSAHTAEEKYVMAEEVVERLFTKSTGLFGGRKLKMGSLGRN